MKIIYRPAFVIVGLVVVVSIYRNSDKSGGEPNASDQPQSNSELGVNTQTKARSNSQTGKLQSSDFIQFSRRPELVRDRDLGRRQGPAVSMQQRGVVKQIEKDGNIFQWIARPGLVPVMRKFKAGNEENNASEWLADSLILTTRASQSSEELASSLSEFGVQDAEPLDVRGRQWRVSISPTSMEDFFRISQQVSSSPLIDSVGNNFILKVGAFPNDPLIPMQYGFGPADSTAFVLGQSGYAVTQQSPEANLRADLAWESKRDCSTISVGVIDSGIDANHPDLNQNLDLANSRNFVPDALLNDDCSQNSVAIPNGGNSIAPAKYFDENGHGTHVAGTIGALGNNGVGVSGVCWNAKIITIRTMNRCGRGSSASIISGINYAAENKIRVVNMSLGGDVSEFVLSPNSAEYRSIAAVGAAGGLVIAAAGNESTDNSVAFKFPASINHPALVSVASHNALNQISEFSNFSANNVHIAAPGEGIVSTIPLAVRSGLAQLINNSDVANLPAAEKFKEAAMTFPQRGYDLKDGTSMAAPHVAGVAALVWSMDPTRSNLEVKELLYETADKVQEFQSRVVEGRRVNLGRALSAAEGLSVRLRTEAGGGRVSASVASSEPIYVRLDGEQVIRFSEGELYLGSEKVGQCSAFDGTCVGRISNSINQTSSDVLSVKKGSQTISAGKVRVIPLSDGNGVFKSGSANFSCRLLEQGKVVASFKAASDEACSNVCRVLSSKVLDGSSVCSFAGKTENINAGACNVPVE